MRKPVVLSMEGQPVVLLHERAAAMAALLAEHQEVLNDPRYAMGKAVLSFIGGKTILTLELSLGVRKVAA
jgi:hypothetical protein